MPLHTMDTNVTLHTPAAIVCNHSNHQHQINMKPNIQTKHCNSITILGLLGLRLMQITPWRRQKAMPQLHTNPAERQENRRNENREEKAIQLREAETEMPNARNKLATERTHRTGKYKPTKTRPTAARLNNYKQKEGFKKPATSKLTESTHSPGDQPPKEVQDKRREPLPAKKSATRNGKRATPSYDKSHIDGVPHKPPAIQNVGNTNAPGGDRTPDRPNDTATPGNSEQPRTIDSHHKGARNPKRHPSRRPIPRTQRLVITHRVYYVKIECRLVIKFLVSCILYHILVHSAKSNHGT